MSEFARTAVAVDQRQEAHRVAEEMYQQNPDWVTFFREILGVEGVVRKLFPEPEMIQAFQLSEEYKQIQQMVAKLREGSPVKEENKEPTRVITVRLPESLHESLRSEAHTKRTSMNKLCISKLLQVISDEFIPAE